MNEQQERDDRAQQLRAQGLKYHEIAERMGERTKQAWLRCNRDRDRKQVRAYKASHRERLREYDRRYDRSYRAICPRCGYEYGIGSGTRDGPAREITFRFCPGCKERRWELIEALWAAGYRYPDIAARLGITQGHLSVQINAARAAGRDIPHRRPRRNLAVTAE